LEADDENKKALWDVIAIIQEMNENPTDDMIPFNKDYWGESYFFD
jgi:hypothetical protein